ncbi:hypothetical protein Purlil1_5654 [Purpureocillium lilacinum]|uniref:Uncharacterized protein n=1 Tax=Purpureocillium lilacinum TaxID=33203 RepID=A0ABR0C113_PURLI|nr:hypothetical protein Purlil1_5654 [Purpureocillium lilacinum]
MDRSRPSQLQRTAAAAAARRSGPLPLSSSAPWVVVGGGSVRAAGRWTDSSHAHTHKQSAGWGEGRKKSWAGTSLRDEVRSGWVPLVWPQQQVVSCQCQDGQDCQCQRRQASWRARLEAVLAADLSARPSQHARMRLRLRLR